VLDREVFDIYQFYCKLAFHTVGSPECILLTTMG